MSTPIQQFTTLKFPSMEELWEFKNLAGLYNYHYDSHNCTLCAPLTEKQFELALLLKATEQPQQKAD